MGPGTSVVPITSVSDDISVGARTSVGSGISVQDPVGTRISQVSDIGVRSHEGQGTRTRQQHHTCVDKKSCDVFHKLSDIIGVSYSTFAVNDRSAVSSVDPGVVPGGEAEEPDRLSYLVGAGAEATNLSPEHLIEVDDKSNEQMVIADDICGAPEIFNLGQFVGIASAAGGLTVSDHMNDRVSVIEVSGDGLNLVDSEKVLYHPNQSNDSDDHRVDYLAAVAHDSTHIEYFKKFNIKPIIVDSGASCVAFADAILFDDLVENHDANLVVSLGSKANTQVIEGVGSNFLFNSIRYVSGLMYNLVALSVLTSYPILWSHKGERNVWTFYDFNGDEVLRAVSYTSNIYYLTEECTESLLFQSTLKTLFGKTFTLNFSTMKYDRNELLDLEEDFLNSVKEVSPSLQERWNKEKESAHIALGHMANDKMVHGARNNLFPGLIRGKLPTPCWGCLLGRMKRSPRGSVTYHDWDIFNKISCDWVPMPTKSYEGNTGYFLFKDYKSDFIYIHCAKSKSSSDLVEGIDKVIIFGRAYNREVKLFQSDDEKIFLSAETQNGLKKHNILFQHSAAYKKSQNGDAESGVQSVDTKHLAIMAENNCPTRFWDFAVREASRIHNVTPKPENPFGLCPYELVTRRRPNYEKAIPFYAAGMYHVTKEERTALKYPLHSKSCHYLGVPEDSPKNVILLDVRDSVIITRGDVAFAKDYKWKRPLEWSEDDPVTIAAVSEDYDDSSWDPNYYDYLQVTELNRQFLSTMQGRENEFAGEVSFNNPEFVPSEELTESLINTMTCPADDVENWETCCSAVAYDLVLPKAPKSVREALDPNNPHATTWWDAIVKELKNLDEAGTFGEAGPTGRGTKTKFVFRVSYDNDMKLKFKARLVFCGYSQIYGLD